MPANAGRGRRTTNITRASPTRATSRRIFFTSGFIATTLAKRLRRRGRRASSSFPFVAFGDLLARVFVEAPSSSPNRRRAIERGASIDQLESTASTHPHPPIPIRIPPPAAAVARRTQTRLLTTLIPALSRSDEARSSDQNRTTTNPPPNPAQQPRRLFRGARWCSSLRRAARRSALD